MRILHLADLHLGTELYGHYDSTTGSSSRLSDFTRMLDIAVEDAIEKRVDLFLFAGDAYKTRDPSPTQQRELAQRLRRLIDAEIPVFLLTGNHDMPNAMARATSLDIFGAFSPSNFVVANRPGAHKLQTRSGPLYVVAIPWLTRSVLLARDENKNLPQEDVHRMMLEKLDQALDLYLGQIPDDDTPAVLALHGTIQGAEYSAERSTMLSQDLLIPRSIISRPRFSYVALGHIHKYQEVYARPLTVYAGSPERIDFGEEKEDKGYVLVNLDRRGPATNSSSSPPGPLSPSRSSAPARIRPRRPWTSSERSQWPGRSSGYGRSCRPPTRAASGKGRSGRPWRKHPTWWFGGRSRRPGGIPNGASNFPPP